MVAADQIRLAGRLLGPVLIVAAGMLVLFALIVITDPGRTGPVDLLPNRFGKLGLLFVLLAPILWRHDEPLHRGYLLAMPFDRAGHLLLRSGAGWLWVMALVGATLATFATLTALTGGSVAVWQPGISFPSGGWPAFQEATAALRELDLNRRQPLPLWQWTVPFVAATVLFLLGNAVAIARNHATLWILGAYIGWQLLVAATESVAPALHLWLKAVIHGRYGLETLLSGNTRYLVHTLQLSSAEVPVHRLTPDFQAWLASAYLWLFIATVATGLALRVRQSQRIPPRD